MTILRRTKNKHRSKPIYVHQKREYMSRKDFENLCFNGVFKYDKLPNGRYYIPIESMEQSIIKHMKCKITTWLNSIVKLHQTKMKKMVRDSN